MFIKNLILVLLYCLFIFKQTYSIEFIKKNNDIDETETQILTGSILNYTISGDEIFPQHFTLNFNAFDKNLSYTFVLLTNQSIDYCMDYKGESKNVARLCYNNNMLNAYVDIYEEDGSVYFIIPATREPVHQVFRSLRRFRPTPIVHPIKGSPLYLTEQIVFFDEDISNGFPDIFYIQLRDEDGIPHSWMFKQKEFLYNDTVMLNKSICETYASVGQNGSAVLCIDKNLVSVLKGEIYDGKITYYIWELPKTEWSTSEPAHLFYKIYNNNDNLKSLNEDVHEEIPGSEKYDNDYYAKLFNTTINETVNEALKFDFFEFFGLDVKKEEHKNVNNSSAMINSTEETLDNKFHKHDVLNSSSTNLKDDHDKNELPKLITVELLIVADDSVENYIKSITNYNDENEINEYLKKYFLHLIDGTEEILKNEFLQKILIKLQINGFLISQTSSNFMLKFNQYNKYQVLENLKEIVENQSLQFVDYDLVIGFTKLEWSNTHIRSISNIGSVCDKEKMYLVLNELLSPKILSHEILHALGAMPQNDKSCLSHGNFENRNNCSKNEMIKLLLDENSGNVSKKCLFNTADKKIVSNETTRPGQIYSLDEQCKIHNSTYRKACFDFANSCTSLFCELQIEDTVNCVEVPLNPLDGTQCGKDGKICMFENCIEYIDNSENDETTLEENKNKFINTFEEMNIYQERRVNLNF